MSEVLVCADLHLGHKVAANYRRYKSVEDHDNHIIHMINKSVDKRSLLLVCGDVAFNKKSLKLLNRVNCRKKLIKGNHDTLKLSDYVDIFDDIHGMYEYKGWCLSHCPIHQNEMYRYIGNIHGHIHQGTKSSEYDFGDKYFNVNWDFHGQPVLITDIIGYKGTLRKPTIVSAHQKVLSYFKKEM